MVDAVQGAVAIQKELKTRNAELPDNRKLHYRIGINVGDVVVEGERIYGDGVNIAARLESLAEARAHLDKHEQSRDQMLYRFQQLHGEARRRI